MSQRTSILSKRQSSVKSSAHGSFLRRNCVAITATRIFDKITHLKHIYVNGNRFVGDEKHGHYEMFSFAMEHGLTDTFSCFIDADQLMFVP